LEERVDATCLIFEEAWKAVSSNGMPPGIEDCLAAVPEAVRWPLLCELFNVEMRYRRNESLSLDEYRRRFPQFEHLLGPILEPELHAVADTTDSPAGVEGGHDPHSTASEAPWWDRSKASPTPTWGSLPCIPGYEMLGLLGRGSMGVVYRARHLQLKRPVALKMICPGTYADPARFLAEAQALARLQHPNIVQVYEVGEHEGLPFLSLQLIEGGSLHTKLAGRPQQPTQAAQLVETLSRAMHFVHQGNIVHRDLKPANVLLCADGEPKVTDFGLAKLLDEAGQTASGAVVGTPSYKAPEQAWGRNMEVGPPADIYALGAILYECLTGRPPFRAATALDTMFQVISDEPVPPRRLQPRLPRDLETICLKCLQKVQKKRYESADALAEDLHRFRERKPILARPVGRLEKAAKWARRNPAVAAFLVLLVVGTVVSTCLAVYAWQQGINASNSAAQARAEAINASNSAAAANEARTRAEKENDRYRHTLYAAHTHLAQREWQGAHINRVLQLLEGEGCRPTREGEPDLRGWEWYYLRGLCHKAVRTFQGEVGEGRGVTFSPDGRAIAVGGPKEVHVWDASSGKIIYILRGHTATVMAVAYSPEGRWLASGSVDGTIKIWDAASGKEIQTLHQDGNRVVIAVAFSSDSQLLASGSQDGKVSLWDQAGGKLIHSWQGHAEETRSVAFSPDKRYLASASSDRSVRLWSVENRQKVRQFVGHTSKVNSVVFSPDGKALATASEDYTVRLWEVDSEKSVRTFAGHTAYVWSVAFSPNGLLLASASDDATVKLWDAASGSEVRTFRGHKDLVRGVAFSPDRRWLASGDIDGSVKLWDLASGSQEYRALGGHSWPVIRLAFSADGRHMASASRDKTVKLWDVASGRIIRTLMGHTDEVGCGFPTGRPQGVKRQFRWNCQAVGRPNGSGAGNIPRPPR
jgi:WD40 repeat protein